MGCVSSVGQTRGSERDEVVLSLKEPTTIPIEADSISPDDFSGRSRDEIAALPVFYGRRRVSLGDLFTVDGSGSENIVVSGDLAHVKRIGQEMSRGSITIRGDVGMHLGAKMRG
ncbi:MAG: formylmethanofuran dehydrogenase subunit C, partial [Anaerolineae bacterium]